MNAVELRKKQAEKLFPVGNLEKAELAKGGEAIRKEVDSKVPILKEMSGYLPGAELLLIPVELTLERFNEYAEYTKRLLSYSQADSDLCTRP